MATRIGVVTVSDRASQGVYEDRSGPAIVALLESLVTSSWHPEARLIPDDPATIEKTLIELVDSGCSLILTTGGTGPAPRDVTPEATTAVCERLLPGFGERMRAVSVDKVPTSILSRQAAGIRGQTLIVNLPGSPRGIRDCLEAVWPAIPHCLELIGAETVDGAGSFEPGH